jgi:hypothetical protein
MTQHAKILEYIETHGAITPMDAFRHLGITKLATRVSEMIRDGVPIVKTMEKYETTEDGSVKSVNFMKYTLEGGKK